MDKVPVHTRFLVADDHPSFRHLLRVFLELHPNWEVCGEASDGFEAIVRTAELHPDIVLMDLDMPKLNGIEATRKIHALSPSTRASLPRMAQDSGAQGFVLKSEPFDVLTKAIETLGTSEGFFVSPSHE